jgi:hypothetical protein
MTFLAPWALWVAGAVSAMIVALHILASRNPRVTPLPTTRFIPDVALRATSRALRLTDMMLLLLRVAIVVLAGLAFARPVPTGTRRAVGRVVMVDRGRAVRSSAESADSVVRLLARGDVLIAFDSAARQLRGASADSLRAGHPSGVTSSLSAALAAGMRAASALRGDADSVELVIVSPFALDEWDAATPAIRAAWPGRVRLVRVAGAGGDSVSPARMEVIGATLNDPVRAVSALLDGSTQRTAATIRIDRGAPASADTAWARDGSRALVRWPASLDSSGWSRRARADATGAVVAGEGEGQAVVVSPFRRTIDPPSGRVVARWVDGAPAATERTMGSGCVRDVAIALPAVGDLALRESAGRLVAALAAPCGGIASATLASDIALSMLRGGAPLVASRALAMRTAPPGRLATLLLIAALALLLLEPLLRRPRVTP